MSVFKSSSFMSAAAGGQDWREAAKAVLEALEEAGANAQNYTLGFLYITDALAEDAQSILNLFQSVLNVTHWVGTVGLGICASGKAYIDEPAISVMLGQFAPEHFQVFDAHTENAETQHAFEDWTARNDPMLICVHSDPISVDDPTPDLQRLDAGLGGFMIGGLSSSRRSHALFANDFFEAGLSGAVFTQSIPIATTLSQGCHIIGGTHTITRADDYTIYELDGRTAVNVFEDDLRAMALEGLNEAHPEGGSDPENTFERLQTMHNLFEGEIHAALPISESDQNDYLVRNIIGLDPDEGSITISQDVAIGERIMFIHRNKHTVYEDLSARLVELRKRIQAETGRFEPKGALYISCVARAFDLSGDEDISEMQLIRDIMGDIPLTGFYSGGEICKARLYGYTGILTLFL